MKIKNTLYRQFLDKGEIQPLTQEHIQQAFKNIKKHHKEARCLLTVLYYTGCRPSEALEIKSKDISKEGQHLRIQIMGKKGGLSRPVFLKMNELTKELFAYASSFFPEMFLFSHFKNSYIRTVKTKQGIKQREDISSKVRYHLQQWFSGIADITPYFLRHNRFSQLAGADVSMEMIRQIKGSRSIESVAHYTHLSSKTAKDIAKKIQ